MRKIREVLRLKFARGMSNRDIARSCQVARSTVGEYVRRAQQAGVSWEAAEKLDDEGLEELLFPPVPGRARHRAQPRPSGYPEPAGTKAGPGRDAARRDLASRVVLSELPRCVRLGRVEQTTNNNLLHPLTRPVQS